MLPGMRLVASRCSDDEIRDWTGLGGRCFAEAVARLWQAHPDRRRGRPWSLDFTDRVLLVALHLRTNLTERQLAHLFSTTDSTVDRVVHDLAPSLAALLGPAPTDRREMWVVDGTLVPVRDHSRSTCSKNYRRSANIQVVTRRRDRKVVVIGKAWPGNRHDSVVFRGDMTERTAGHRRLIGDGGYQAVVGVTSPARGPDGRIVRDASWRRFRKRRAVAEHVIGGLKTWSALRDCRRKGDGINQVAAGVAALWNLRIETRDI